MLSSKEKDSTMLKKYFHEDKLAYVDILGTMTIPNGPTFKLPNEIKRY